MYNSLFDEQKPETNMTVASKKVTNTLSRWHKIAERANARLNELTNEAQILLAPRSTNVEDADADFAKVKIDAAKTNAIIAEIASVSRTVTVVRSALAKTNASVGVSDVLAKIEENKRTMSMLSVFVGNGRYQTVDKAKTVVQRKKTEISGFENKSGEAKELVVWLETARRLKGENVSFVPFGETEIENAKAEIDTLRKANLALSDELSDKNATRLEIEVELVAAASIGL